MALVLECAVAQFAEAVEKDGAGERIAGFTLVEDAAGATPLFGIVEPVEHEQGALDPPELAQCASDRVLTRKTWRATGIAMAQRLADRRQDVSDLSEAEIIALLHSCFLEVAPRQYAHLDQENLATSIDKMFGNISMEVAATANSSPTMQ